MQEAHEYLARSVKEAQGYKSSLLAHAITRGGRETKRDEESLHEELIVEMDLEAWAKHLISRDRRRIWSQ